jgi:hypothetical protein
MWSGRYTVLRYDCASDSVAHWVNRLAKKVGLTSSDFTATVQTCAEEIVALAGADATHRERSRDDERSSESSLARRELSGIHPVVAPPAPVPAQPEPVAPLAPEPETPEAAAERERRYREIFGIPEPKARRRWRC